MNRSLSLPLAIVAGSIAIGAALAVGPGRSSNAPVGTPAPASALAAAPASGGNALAPYLRFSGTGTVTVKPDQAELGVGVIGRGKTSQEALADATKRIDAVTKKLKELGVAADDLQTSGAGTWEDGEKTGNWRADVSLRVKVREIGRAGELLTAANAAGADSVYGPTFSVSETRDAYAQALRQAVEDARSKADAIAAQLGVRVTGVVSVEDQSGGGGPIVYATKAEVAADGGAGGAPLPVETGTQDIAATVSVVFSYGS